MKNHSSVKQPTPKGHEIPVPTPQEFMENLEKAAKPKKASQSRRPKK
jgi:hypothetical protein